MFTIKVRMSGGEWVVWGDAYETLGAALDDARGLGAFDVEGHGPLSWKGREGEEGERVETRSGSWTLTFRADRIVSLDD